MVQTSLGLRLLVASKVLAPLAIYTVQGTGSADKQFFNAF